MFGFLPYFFHGWIAWGIVLAGWILLILITREIWCWYFKLNQIRDLLTEIRDDLRGGSRSAPAAPHEPSYRSPLPPL